MIQILEIWNIRTYLVLHRLLDDFLEIVREKENGTDSICQIFTNYRNQEKHLPREMPVPIDICIVHYTTGTDSDGGKSWVLIQKLPAKINRLLFMADPKCLVHVNPYVIQCTLAVQISRWCWD